MLCRTGVLNSLFASDFVLCVLCVESGRVHGVVCSVHIVPFGLHAVRYVHLLLLIVCLRYCELCVESMSDESAPLWCFTC